MNNVPSSIRNVVKNSRKMSPGALVATSLGVAAGVFLILVAAGRLYKHNIRNRERLENFASYSLGIVYSCSLVRITIFLNQLNKHRYCDAVTVKSNQMKIVRSTDLNPENKFQPRAWLCCPIRPPWRPIVVYDCGYSNTNSR